jgi:precorrin-2 dehydrogenase / sirohydrochlorin ferrochelatase
MSRVCESWSLEELCDMEEDDMDKLLSHYRDGDVPSFAQVRGTDDGDNEKIIGFDGSFGWW